MSLREDLVARRWKRKDVLALGWMFLSETYARHHGGGFPGSLNRKRLRKKRHSVMVKWWNRLTPDERRQHVARWSKQVSAYNAEVARFQDQLRRQIDEISSRIREIKRAKRRAVSHFEIRSAPPHLTA